MIKNFKDFEKNLAKHNIKVGFAQPDHWISTGIYALNFLTNGRFNVGIPNRRSTLLWGPSGSGKSYILSNLCKQAQDDGYHVVYIDTETAMDDVYLAKIGVNLSKDVFTPIQIATIEEATATMSDLFQSLTPTDKVFVAFDSLSMAISEKESDDFEKGDMKGDQGQLAKKLKLFFKNVNSKIGHYDMFFVTTAHAYQNQNQYTQSTQGQWIISGGRGIEYIPSTSIFLERSPLKDEDKDIVGIVSNAQITKARFAQYGTKVKIEIPYATGFDPLSGLLEMTEEAGLVTKNSAWYTYQGENGPVKFQKSSFSEHYRNILDFDSQEAAPEEREDDGTPEDLKKE
jgi:RecA/RadA recombinase